MDQFSRRTADPARQVVGLPPSKRFSPEWWAWIAHLEKELGLEAPKRETEPTDR